MAEGAGREELDHQQIAVAVDHQPGQAVALGVHHPPGIRHRIQLQHLAAQGHRLGDLALEEGGIDRLLVILGQYPQGDARMAVVEATADPVVGGIDDINNRAGTWLDLGLFHHFLENPRVGRFALDFQADEG